MAEKAHVPHCEGILLIECAGRAAGVRYGRSGPVFLRRLCFLRDAAVTWLPVYFFLTWPQSVADDHVFF